MRSTLEPFEDVLNSHPSLPPSPSCFLHTNRPTAAVAGKANTEKFEYKDIKQSGAALAVAAISKMKAGSAAEARKLREAMLNQLRSVRGIYRGRVATHLIWINHYSVKLLVAYYRITSAEEELTTHKFTSKSYPKFLCREELAKSASLKGLKKEQLQLLTKEDLGKMTVEQLASLPPSMMAHFTAEQLQGLSESQVAALTVDHLAAMNPEQARCLSCAYVYLSFIHQQVWFIGFSSLTPLRTHICTHTRDRFPPSPPAYLHNTTRRCSASFPLSSERR